MVDLLGSKEKNELEENGYTVVRNVFTQDEVDKIKKVYESIRFELLKEGKIKQSKKYPIASLYPRLRDYHYKNDYIRQIALDPRLFNIIESCVQEEALLVSTSYYFKGPGMKEMPDHQDNYAIGADPVTSYSAWISLDHADKENGGLRFYPKTHKLGLLPPKKISKDLIEAFSDEGQVPDLPDKYNEVDYLTTAPGDVVIFTGDSVHGSTDNLSKYRFRNSLLIHYAGQSVERLILNFNHLINKEGIRVRRRLNTRPKITENNKSVFAIKQAGYYENNGWT